MKALYWLSLAGLIYGSLFPFDFVIPRIDEIDINEFFSFNSLADTISNIVLLLPVGVLARLSGKDVPEKVARLAFLALGVAVTSQLLQVFVPARYPGLLDMVMNFVGLGLGIWIAPHVTTFARRYSYLRIELPPTVIFLSAAFFSAQLFPFIPTLYFYSFRRNYWALLKANESIDWHTIISLGVTWFVFFTLVIPVVTDRRLRRLVYLAPIAIFGARLLIVSNVATLWQLAGGLIGAGTYLSMVNFAPARPLIRPIAIAALVCVVAWEGFTPFAPRLHPVSMSLIPFHSVLTGSTSAGFLAIVWKTYLYGSLLLLVWLSGSARLASTISLAAALLLIELAQIRYVSGVPELTDPVLVVVLGVFLTRLMMSPDHDEVDLS